MLQIDYNGYVNDIHKVKSLWVYQSGNGNSVPVLLYGVHQRYTDTGPSDPKTIALVRLAANCAETVYDRERKTVIPGLTLPTSDFELVREIAATAAGDFKATSFQIHQLNRTLVIAIRGTKKTSPIDWITNANGKPEDASSVSCEFKIRNDG